MKELESIFKRCIFKKITENFTTKYIIPDNVEYLIGLLRRITLKGSSKQLMEDFRWIIILEKLRNLLPKINNRRCEEILRNYFDRWYTKVIKIQKIRKIFQKILYKHDAFDDYIKLATLQKWRKNARIDTCHMYARIIQKFCIRAHEKALLVFNKKLGYMESYFNIIYKRRALYNIINSAKKRALYEILETIISKYENNLIYLLRIKFHQWLEKVRKSYSASYNKSTYRGFKLRKDIDRKLYRLFTLKEKYLKELLRKKLRQWEDKVLNNNLMRYRIMSKQSGGNALNMVKINTTYNINNKNKYYSRFNIYNNNNMNNNSINNINDHFISNNNNNRANLAPDSIFRYNRYKKKVYLYECLNPSELSKEIYQGTNGVEIKIILKNNGHEIWPNNAKLITDKSRSNLTIEEIILEPQKPGEQKEYYAIFQGLLRLSVGDYKSYLCFYVNNEFYGEKLVLNVKIIKKDKNMIEIEKNIFQMKEY